MDPDPITSRPEQQGHQQHAGQRGQHGPDPNALTDLDPVSSRPEPNALTVPERHGKVETISRMGQWGHLQQPGHWSPQGSQYPLKRTPPAGTTGRDLPATSREDSISPTRGSPASPPPTDTLAGLVLPARGRQNPSSRGHSRPGVSPAMVPSTSTTDIREGTDRGPPTDRVGAFVTSTGSSLRHSPTKRPIRVS